MAPPDEARVRCGNVNRETLAVFLAIAAVLIIVDLAWMVDLTRDIGRMVKAVAGLV